MTVLGSVLFNAFFFASTFVLSLWGVAIRLFAPQRGLGLVRAWARTELWAARVFCGIRFAVSGLENLPGGKVIVASQHQSAFDTMVWFLLLPRCTYVLKRELAGLPLFGPLVRLSGMIVVDRAAGAPAIRMLVRDGRAALAAGREIVIFPEGTRAEPGRPMEVQPGIAALAAATGAAVVPVVTDSGRLWGRRAFRKRPGVIRVTVLPPLPAGLPRRDLVARLAALYQQGGTGDNSVGG